ncbi:MAG: MFS transporter [Mycobacterium sp.]
MSTPPGPVEVRPNQSRRVALSSLAGTTIEWYEFFIYAIAAALVFDKLFFPNFDPVVGRILSLSTFTIAFIARPVGAAVFGHFGDRIGRKKLLVITLSVMGGATVLIGVLPTYDQIGVAAPILLAALRFAQGFSLGGEYSGAVLMSVEHAPAKKRGMLSSIVNTGSALGLMLANLAFLLLERLPDEAFLSYGWRIPFLLAGVLVFFGLFIRVSLDESPEFQKVAANGNIVKMPVKVVLTRYPKLVVLMALSYLSIGTVFYVLTVFSISYGTEQIDVEESLILRVILLSTIFIVIGIPFFGWLSDRIGRRRIFLAGVVGMAVLPWAWFVMFNSGNPVVVFLGFLLIFIPYCANYGTMPAYFSLVFPPEVRYTGLAIGYTLGTLVTSMAPIVATYLMSKTGAWQSIAIYMTVSGIVSLGAAYLMKEHSPVSRKEAASVQS